MIKFSKEKVLLLHRLIAEETGRALASGMRLCWSPRWGMSFSGFGGQEFYPTKEEKKGARLGLCTHLQPCLRGWQ